MKGISLLCACAAMSVAVQAAGAPPSAALMKQIDELHTRLSNSQDALLARMRAVDAPPNPDRVAYELLSTAQRDLSDVSRELDFLLRLVELSGFIRGEPGTEVAADFIASEKATIAGDAQRGVKLQDDTIFYLVRDSQSMDLVQRATEDLKAASKLQ